MSKQKKKIDHLIFFFLIIAFCVIIGIQIFYFMLFSRQSQKDQETILTNHVTTMQQNIEMLVQSIPDIQRSILSESMYSFLQTPNSVAQLDILSDIFICRSLSQNNFYSIVFDKHDKSYTLTSDIDPTITKKIQELHREYDCKKPFTTFFTTENTYNDTIYVCNFEPIYTYSLKEVKSELAGVSAIISKINIAKYKRYLNSNSSIEISLTCKKEKLGIKTSEFHSDTISEYIRPIGGTSWNIHGIISIDRFMFFNQNLFVIVLFESLVLLSILLIFHFIYNRYISSPIRQISEILNTYTILDQHTPLPPQKTYEFEKISYYINTMIQKNSELMHTIFNNQQNMYEKELENEAYRFYALQAQINPHFIYNTLDCVSSLAYINNIDSIATVTNALSKLLHYSIINAPETTVNDEIIFIKNYFNIMKIRYPNRISLLLDIDPSVLDFKIFRMTLQPLIENSIKHNNLSAKKLLVYVKGYIFDDKLRITITDNGRGISKEKSKSLQEALAASSASDSATLKTSKHIGICNINHRLKLAYGNEYGINITSIENKFFKLIIDIPINIETI